LTVVVNGSQTYGGTPVFTPTYSGFVASDTLASAVQGMLACVTEATSTSAVGTSPAIDSCSGLTAANYTITYVYGALTIIPAPLTIIVTGTPPSVTVATPYTGLVNGDTDSAITGAVSCTANATADAAGDTPISCSGLTAPSYYAISYSYAAANTINPAPLTVAVSGSQPGAGPATFTITYSGFINGDLPAVVAGTLSCTPNSGSTPYSITSCSGLSAPAGYAISYWPGMVQ
jgi:hypothetical protein